MPFDFQQREGFLLHVVFILEDAAVGDAILHHFMRILPSTQEVDAGASVRDHQNVLVVVLFHDFGAGPDHPFHYLITGFSTVLQEKSAFVFGIQVFALAFEGAEMHFLQAFQALVRHQFVRHNLQCIASALGCGAVGMVKIDIIKVGTGDSGLLDAELRQRRIACSLDFSADIEKGLAMAHQVQRFFHVGSSWAVKRMHINYTTCFGGQVNKECLRMLDALSHMAEVIRRTGFLLRRTEATPEYGPDYKPVLRLGQARRRRALKIPLYSGVGILTGGTHRFRVAQRGNALLQIFLLKTLDLEFASGIMLSLTSQQLQINEVLCRGKAASI